MHARRVILVQATFLLYAALQAFSQFQGAVTDSEGATISKTTIRVLDGKTRKVVEIAQTDPKGRFNLRDLHPGSYAVTFSSAGFSPEMIEVDTRKIRDGAFQTVRLTARECDAPNEVCDTLSSDNPIPEPHRVVSRGAMMVGWSDAVDLNERIVVSPTSRSADFQLTENDGGIYVTPLNGAARQSVCGTEFNRRRAKKETSALRIDGMGEGSEICMETTHGRFSKIYLTHEVQPGDQQIAIYVVTRDK